MNACSEHVKIIPNTSLKGEEGESAESKFENRLPGPTIYLRCPRIHLVFVTSASAAPHWDGTDQHVRWINPYFTEPDMAAVVEHLPLEAVTSDS
jgi:hypothetical protein